MYHQEHWIIVNIIKNTDISRQMITCHSMKELGLVPFLCCCCFFIGILLKSISFLLCVECDVINLIIHLFIYFSIISI